MASTGDALPAGPSKGPADCFWLPEVEALAGAHPLFERLYRDNGCPPSWRRPASLDTLVRLILEQQVSLASANAAFARLIARVGDLTPLAILESSDAELKADGFSRQKAGYVKGIAREMLEGDLDLDSLIEDPESAPDRLLAIRGIGPWTVACFRVFVLLEPDVWPTGDRALYVSLARNLDLEPVPSGGECDEIAAAWAPHRSTAARMLWHDYLGGRSFVQAEGAGFLEAAGRVPT